MTLSDVQEATIAAARACRAWTELDASQLVQRDGYVVDVASDAAYRAYRGDAFSRGRVVSDMTPLYFVVADGRVRVYERESRLWSEILYQRERRLRAVR